MKIKPLLPLFLALTLFTACKNTTTVVENDTGTFRGNIALLDANGDTLPNYSGATAQIQGTAFQATSMANGDWQINNVPAGIYNILLTKPGFDTLIIPQYQFSGAGTTFLLNNAIQAFPMDSLVFTIADTSYGNSGVWYLTMTGRVAGHDSLQEGRYVASFGSQVDSGFDTSLNVYVLNGMVPSQGAINYATPSMKSGTVVTVWSYLWAKIPANYASYAHYQQSTSPYSVERTFILP